jgi:hypothetical protein
MQALHTVGKYSHDTELHPRSGTQNEQPPLGALAAQHLLPAIGREYWHFCPFPQSKPARSMIQVELCYHTM